MLGAVELQQTCDKLAEFQNLNGRHHDLLSGLLTSYSVLLEEYRRLKSDHEDVRIARDHYKSMAQTPTNYALVLVDANESHFDDEFTSSRGTGGGERAAKALREAVKSDLKDRGLDDCQLIVRVYGNLTAISRDLAARGLVDSEPRSLSLFFSSFTHANPLFDFIDTGEIKGKTQAKIKANLSLAIDDPRIKQIYFAGCHDPSYMPELNALGAQWARGSLVKTASSNPEFSTLSMPWVDLKVFRRRGMNRNLRTPNSKSATPWNKRSDESDVSMAKKVDLCPFHQRGFCRYGLSCNRSHDLGPTSTSTSNAQRVENWRQSTTASLSPRPLDLLPATASNGESSDTSSRCDENPQPQATAPSPTDDPNPSSTAPSSDTPPAPLNAQTEFAHYGPRKGRIDDPSDPDYMNPPSTFTGLPAIEDIPPDRVAINQAQHRLDSRHEPTTNRVRYDFFSRFASDDTKLCNSYMLIGDCEAQERCKFSHRDIGRPLRSVLRAEIHKRPCPKGGSCRSIRCTYGHICQELFCEHRGGNEPCLFPKAVHSEELEMWEFVLGIVPLPSKPLSAKAKPYTSPDEHEKKRKYEERLLLQQERQRKAEEEDTERLALIEREKGLRKRLQLEQELLAVVPSSKSLPPAAQEPSDAKPTPPPAPAPPPAEEEIPLISFDDEDVEETSGKTSS